MKQGKPSSASLSPSATFISGAEHKDMIGHYINCSANPHDLRPAADVILAAAFAMRATMPEGQPLVILMGDPHSVPAHLELQHLVASRLLEQNQQFTFNFEGIHNTWGTFARYSMDKRIPDDLYYSSSDYDLNGQAALTATLGYSGIRMAPTTFFNLAAFLHDKEVPTIFNDAIYRAGGLDLQDPYTAALAQREELVGSSSDLSSQEDMPKRIHDRNITMQDRGLKAAKSLQKNTILQHAGTAHLFGWEQAGLSYETSLCAAYLKAGAAVLPVFITRQQTTHPEGCGLNILPEGAYPALSHSVVIDGLSEDEFEMGQEGAEQELIQKLHQESGGELEFYDVAAERGKYKTLAHAEADALIQRFEMSEP